MGDSSIETRRELFNTLANLIEERSREIMEVMHLETGKLYVTANRK